VLCRALSYSLLHRTTQIVGGVCTNDAVLGEEFPEETQQQSPMPTQASIKHGQHVQHSPRTRGNTSSDSMFPDSRDEMSPGGG
jgi:hypothetical protein